MFFSLPTKSETDQLFIPETNSVTSHADDPAKITGSRFHKVFSCEGHISSVRCLAYINVYTRVINGMPSHKHLLFSGGSRASLKCWSLNVDLITRNESDGKSSKINASSCSLLAELRSPTHRYRKKKQLGRSKDEEFSCDIRFMSLSTFSLTDFANSTAGSDTVGLIAGCSDGYLRCAAYLPWTDYEQMRVFK